MLRAKRLTQANVDDALQCTDPEGWVDVNETYDNEENSNNHNVSMVTSSTG
jgi:hypothetical protein